MLPVNEFLYLPSCIANARFERRLYENYLEFALPSIHESNTLSQSQPKHRIIICE